MAEIKHELLAAVVEPCATCRFWHRDDSSYIFGFCRRWPARAGFVIHAAKAHQYDRIEVTMSTSSNAEWPNTKGDEGCGEHQERYVP